MFGFRVLKQQAEAEAKQAEYEARRKWEIERKNAQWRIDNIRPDIERIQWAINKKEPVAYDDTVGLLLLAHTAIALMKEKYQLDG